jgi:hypothetical protein
MRHRHLRLAIALASLIIGVAATFAAQSFFKPEAKATDFPEPLKIIQAEGRFVFTDGSSYYSFKRDGTFKSGPMGLSGREITGTWKSEDRLFVIEGIWGWMNGVSPVDDYRKMTIYVSTPISVETAKRMSPVDASANVKIYNCYFIVEELRKVKGAGEGIP